MRTIIAFVLGLLLFAPASGAAQEVQYLGSLKLPDLNQYDITTPAKTDSAKTADAATSDFEGRHIDNLLYRASQMVLVGGSFADSWTTVHNMTNPPSLSYDFPAFDAASASVLLQRQSVTRSMPEAGWSSNFVDPYSPTKVTMAGAALDVAYLFVSHELATRGGRWGKRAGTVLNFVHGVDHTAAAIHNFRGWNAAQDGLSVYLPPGAVNISR